MSNDKNNQDLEFEQLMEQRIRDNFATPASGGVQISDERLKKKKKKLHARKDAQNLLSSRI